MLLLTRKYWQHTVHCLQQLLPRLGCSLIESKKGLRFRVEGPNFFHKSFYLLGKERMQTGKKTERGREGLRERKNERENRRK
mmetsp:Transcript_11237/g.15683  ORF Transcript_11237/g.15683 Transcript_11237/m.15683 type:complete len:82 (-) Transcript_11237:11-256(-)